MNYTVTFIQYHEYDVEAKTTMEAEKIAYKRFKTEMSRPIANTHYDDVEIEPDYDDDDEEEETT